MIGPRVKPRVSRLPVFDPIPAPFDNARSALQSAQGEQSRPRIGWCAAAVVVVLTAPRCCVLVLARTVPTIGERVTGAAQRQRAGEINPLCAPFCFNSVHPTFASSLRAMVFLYGPSA